MTETFDDATGLPPGQPVAPRPRGTVRAELGAELGDSLFPRLVDADEDVVGLLAYSLAMQNRRDWIAAFRDECGRDPVVDEIAAFEIGERIERRLATYRALAEAALSGSRGFAGGAPVGEFTGDVETIPAAAPLRATPSRVPSADRALAQRKIIGGLVLFVVLVAAVILMRRALGI